jgi:hypothetical protein
MVASMMDSCDPFAEAIGSFLYSKFFSYHIYYISFSFGNINNKKPIGNAISGAGRRSITRARISGWRCAGMSHDFSVDKFSDDETCDRAIEQLERVVALGEQAKRALEAIRTQGYYEGRAPLAGNEIAQWYDGVHGTMGHTVRFAVLKKRQPFSRADLPPLDNLQLVFKDANMDAQYSGHPCILIDLYCHGQVARQIDSAGTLQFFEEEQHLGTIHINKNHLSFIENSNNKTVHVFPNLSKAPAEKAKESAKVFSERLARLMMREGVDLSDAQSASGGKFVQMTARTLDLQNTSPQWFIEDGVVQRMYEEIYRYVSVLEVMEA